MRTIAVVEDNPSMLQGLDRLLSAHGFRVQTFTSAELFLDDIAKCEAGVPSLGHSSRRNLGHRLKAPIDFIRQESARHFYDRDR